MYRCQYNIVRITKYRYKVLVEGVKEYVLLKIKEIREHYPEVEYIEINVQAGYVHRVVSFPPKYSIEKIVQIIKTNTSKEIFEKFKFLKEDMGQDTYGR